MCVVSLTFVFKKKKKKTAPTPKKKTAMVNIICNVPLPIGISNDTALHPATGAMPKEIINFKTELPSVTAPLLIVFPMAGMAPESGSFPTGDVFRQHGAAQRPPHAPRQGHGPKG